MMKGYQKERKRPPGDPDTPHAWAGYEGIKEETQDELNLSQSNDDVKHGLRHISTALRPLMYRLRMLKGGL